MRRFFRRPATRAARATLGILVLAVLLNLVTVAVYAGIVVGQAPAWQRFTSVGSLEVDGDLFAVARILPREDVQSFVAYSVGGGLDTVGVYREDDVPALLAGGSPEPLRTWPSPQPAGQLRFDGPGDCRECSPGKEHVLVFQRGDAWRGKTVEDLVWEHVVFTTGDDDAARSTFGYAASAPHASYSMDWDGQVGVAFVHAPDAVFAAERVAVPLAWLSLAAALAAAAAWAVAVRLAPREPTPDPVAPAGAGTAELLYLVRLGSLYADGVKRAYVLTAFAIVAGAVLVWLAGFSFAQDATYRSFVMADPAPTLLLFGAAPFGLAAVGLVAWGVAYARVREELRRWQATSARFEEEVSRILGA